MLVLCALASFSVIVSFPSVCFHSFPVFLPSLFLFFLPHNADCFPVQKFGVCIQSLWAKNQDGCVSFTKGFPVARDTYV